MAFKKTICEDIWLVFMTINAQVCFVLLSYIPPSAEFLPSPILEVAQLRHQGIGIDVPDWNAHFTSCMAFLLVYPKALKGIV